MQTGTADRGWRSTTSYARRKYAPGEITIQWLCQCGSVVLEYDIVVSFVVTRGKRGCFLQIWKQLKKGFTLKLEFRSNNFDFMEM